MQRLPTPFEQIKMHLTSLLLSFDYWPREQQIQNVTYLIQQIEQVGDFKVPVHAIPTTQKTLAQLMLHIRMSTSRMEATSPLTMQHVACHLQALLVFIRTQEQRTS